MTTALAPATLAAALLALAGCAANPKPAPIPVSQQRLDTLKQWMTGSFASTKQAAEDPSYFDIRLQIAPIWPEQPAGPWLYIEQARADTLDQPYRQRVYRLSVINDTTFKSEVFEFQGDALRFAGAHAQPKLLADTSPADLKPREGCAVVLTFDEKSSTFVGGTEGTNCLSSLRGATYATSQVTLTPTALNSWDRGFDDAGKQVWGATKGGYRFDKSPAPAPAPAPTK